ncbi:MAG: hypothetical protein GF388_08785 [Candidatus Aegiribacteria sp.]|nr:hypothetical protein [Candidatus Aegiribacteria sp.]MBD3295172.1 hypothetical protein [Candidatus Fermentibacteria bacterium]
MKTILVVLLVVSMSFASNYLGDNSGQPVSGRASLTVLDSFDPALGDQQVGLGYDGANGQFWVAFNENASGTGQNVIVVFEGTSPYSEVETFDQNNTSGWGILDMAYNAGIMYVSDFNANIFNYYNTTTQEKLGSFNAYTSGSYAVATDGAGVFYTGDFNTGGHVYSATWDGVSGSSPSWSQFTTTALAETGILGAAYDASWPCLWVAVSSGTGTIYQVAMDGSFMEVFDQSAQGANPAGADMAPYATDADKLWVLFQADPDMVYCLDSQVAIQRETWGTIKTMF